MTIDERLANTNFPLPAIRQVNLAKHKTGISLGLGELKEFKVDPLVTEALAKSLTCSGYSYTHNAGLPELRSAIAESYSRDSTYAYGEDNVIITIGVQNALYCALKTLAKLGAKRVLIPEIHFGIYKKIPVEFNLIVETYPLTNDFGIDTKSLECILQTDDIVILNSPSNPTGRVFSNVEQKALASIFNNKLKDGYVVSDEIYSKLTYEGESTKSFESFFNRTIVLDGISKSGAAAGLRVGWALSQNENLIKAMVSNNATIISSPPTANQYAALPIVKNQTLNTIVSYNEQLKQNCNYVSNVLAELNIPFVKPTGSFYIFPNLLSYIGKDTKGFCINTAKSENGVVVIPGAAFGAPSHIRISLATAQIEEGMQRLKRFLLLNKKKHSVDKS